MTGVQKNSLVQAGLVEFHSICQNALTPKLFFNVTKKIF